MTPEEERFINLVDAAVRAYFEGSAPEESAVRERYKAIYDGLAGALPKDSASLNRDEVIERLAKKFCAEQKITKKVGFAYKDDECKPWLRETEPEIEKRSQWFYWHRYKNYLIGNKKWAPAAVRSIDQDTYAILDLMANPLSKEGFERRGLVVASVQSGKTANYIGLICRAADAGYKIIIVMAGVHNVLRNQTQIRIEEGFTGFDIVDSERHAVGVGIADLSHMPIVCTSREADFNSNRANALKGIQTSNTDAPWLFVIKKNSNALKQIYEWLQINAKQDDQLLLIDDEADNASINGKYKRDSRNDEPTRINGQIRNILNFFSRKCYVGYTATPFANILIDPDVDTDKYGKDLFPSSFIYTLEESSDYFGADKVFSDMDARQPKHLRYIFDIDSVLPPKHRSTFRVAAIPESLKIAVRTFLLATTIRALRGDGDAHSTMMINVSPYKSPQKDVAALVSDYLDQLKRSVQAFASLPEDLALKSSSDLRLIKETWSQEYADATEFDWEDIQNQLTGTTQTMHVISINTDSNERLEYDLHTEHVIAVGGYRLSRGLTLEGLVVSYYSRNAKAYDALMQMARWFGYRPGYEDLCRIWMTDQAAGWYKFVADSTEALFDELRSMRAANRTPRNYGLMIRQSPDTLMVTARNKMGTGKKLKVNINLSDHMIETVALNRNLKAIENNRHATARLLDSASAYRQKSSSFLYQRVPANLVVDFINSFINDDAFSMQSQKKPILDYILDCQNTGELNTWDIFVAYGSGNKVRIADGIDVQQEIRAPGKETTGETLVVGENQRLSSRGVEKWGLTDSQIKRAERNFVQDFKDRWPDKTPGYVSDRYYRHERKRPLLVIHPVLMKYSETQRNKREKNGEPKPTVVGWDSWEHAESAIGWSISFPRTAKPAKLVEYVFNQVALDNIRSDFEEDSDDNTEDDS